MPLQNFRRLVLAGIETTYGTDPTLTGSNAVKLARDLEFNPLDSDNVELDYLVGYMGNNSVLVTGQRCSLRYSVDLASSGTAGTAPAYSAMMRGCGMSELITAGTSVVYKPASSSFDAVTHYHFLDGQRHVVTGCRGNVMIRAAVKGLVRAQFAFQGLYNAPTGVSNPTPTVSGYQTPLPVTKDTVQTMTLHGYAGKVYDFELDVGQEVALDETMSSREIIIGGRSTKGTITFQEPALSDKDWYAAILAATQAAFAFQISTTAGKIVKIDAPKVQLVNPRKGNQNGIATLQCDLVVAPNAGNDEIVITVQ